MKQWIAQWPASKRNQCHIATTFTLCECCFSKKTLFGLIWCWLLRVRMLEIGERKQDTLAVHACWRFHAWIRPELLGESFSTWRMLKIVLISLICLFSYLTWLLSSGWEGLEKLWELPGISSRKENKTNKQINKQTLPPQNKNQKASEREFRETIWERIKLLHDLKSRSFNKNVSCQSYKHIYYKLPKSIIMKA